MTNPTPEMQPVNIRSFKIFARSLSISTSMSWTHRLESLENETLTSSVADPTQTGRPFTT